VKGLAEIFPKASKSFLEANAEASPQTHSPKTVIHKSRLNKTEAEFSLLLEAQKRKGEIDGWMFEGVKLRLADGCWYTPDFMTWSFAGKSVLLRFYEVKGAHVWDDAKVKYKVARHQIAWAKFECWQKLQGQWRRLG